LVVFELCGADLEGVHIVTGSLDMQRGIGPWSSTPPMTLRSDAASPPRLAHVTSTTCTSVVVQWCRCQDSEENGKYEAQLSAASPYAKKHLSGGKGCIEEWQTVYTGSREGCEVGLLQPGCNYSMRVRRIINGCASPWSKAIQV
jgi:hypothetical protein